MAQNLTPMAYGPELKAYGDLQPTARSTQQAPYALQHISQLL